MKLSKEQKNEHKSLVWLGDFYLHYSTILEIKMAHTQKILQTGK